MLRIRSASPIASLQQQLPSGGRRRRTSFRVRQDRIVRRQACEYTCRRSTSTHRMCSLAQMRGLRKVLVASFIIECAALVRVAGATAEDPDGASTVIVAGERAPDIEPILEVAPAEIGIYGADSLQELLDALAPQTRSSSSDEPPLILINGRRAGPVE